MNEIRAQQIAKVMLKEGTRQYEARTAPAVRRLSGQTWYLLKIAFAEIAKLIVRVEELERDAENDRIARIEEGERC